VTARLPELRRRRQQFETDLAALAPMPKVVELHPAAATRYLASVEELAATLQRRMVDGNEEAAGALRELIAAVVICPKKGEPDVRGDRTAGEPDRCGTVSANGGSGEWDRTTDLRIMIPPL
jgi:hypothetical protein